MVFREVTTREANLPNWREILICLRRMEDRGEVRGGRFVSGYLGEQFALPQALDSLRASRKRLAEASGEEVLLKHAAAILDSEEPEVRRYPMLRHHFGAYAWLDDALAASSRPASERS